jgi:hypothetical protein
MDASVSAGATQTLEMTYLLVVETPGEEATKHLRAIVEPYGFHQIRQFQSDLLFENLALRESIVHQSTPTQTNVDMVSRS